MTGVSNELILDVLRKVQVDLSDLKNGQAEIKSEIQAVRSHQLAIQQDTTNLYASVSHMQTRIERVENRLEPSDA